MNRKRNPSVTQTSGGCLTAPLRLPALLRRALTALLPLLMPLLSAGRAAAQEPNAASGWQSLLSIGEVTAVQDTPDAVFAASARAFFSVNPQQEESLAFFDRSRGVSDIGVQQIAYHAPTQTLVVVYQSGLIDLIRREGIDHLSAIYDNTNLPDKQAHRVVFGAGYAFVAGNFGLCKIDPADNQVQATAFVGQQVRSALCTGSTLYALAPQGLLYTSVESNIQDPAQWTTVPLPNSETLRTIDAQSGTLFLLDSLGALSALPLDAVQSSDGANPAEQIKPIAEDVREITATGAGMVIHYDNRIEVIAPDGSTRSVSTPLPVHSASCHNEQQILWVADGSNISSIDLSLPAPTPQILHLDYSGPADNRYFYGLCAHGSYYSVGGGRTSNRQGLPGSVKVYSGTQWMNLTPQEVEPKSGITFSDAVSVAVDPADKSHFFVGTWGEGLYEFRENTFYARRAEAPLQSAVEGDPHYVRVGSLSFDGYGRLWMAQGSVSDPIRSLEADGRLAGYRFDAVSGVNSFGTMLCLPGGTNWLALNHRGGDQLNGLFVFNINNTPSDPSDDKSLLISQFSDRAGKAIAATKYYDLAVDKSGTLWVGTDKGPLMIYGAASVLSSASVPTATRPVGGKEPNLYYVLDNISVSSIAVDAQNNKWIGTHNDGLYLLSPDGSELIRHFTVADSPLLSNSVTTLSIDEGSGILYIGTTAGLMTYNIGAGADFNAVRSEAYVYPNPVRPEDSDLVTVKGLLAGSVVRVADMAGRVLYQEQAVTSELTFYARLNNGERYPSGVYQVIISDPTARKTHTLRFAVIN